MEDLKNDNIVASATPAAPGATSSRQSDVLEQFAAKQHVVAEDLAAHDTGIDTTPWDQGHWANRQGG